MSKFTFYPYPRLQSVQWSELSANFDGELYAFEKLPDVWDSNSEVTFRVSASVDNELFETVNVDSSSSLLVIEVTCRDTAYSLTMEASFTRKVDILDAVAEITVSGSSVSESIELSAFIIGPVDEQPWLRRAVLAEGPSSRVALNSDLVGFPTSAFSFVEEHLPPAPWRLAVTAEDIEAPFAHSVRLELNEDFQVVRDLIAGKANPSVHADLVSSITRVLIGTIAGIKNSTSDSRMAAEVAKEAPNSIVAAAARASEQYLSSTIDSAISMYFRQPELFDYKLLTGSDLYRMKS
ncbi:hypothetical protein ACT3TP_16280 [Glutamicibacter sp. AOP38-B1-38]|uniref:hypothetical protein n=1 Tax=unclassified Glutamicibacter TaxID=2627139 RepID=UPI004033B518